MTLALELVPRLRADAAVDEFYRPYAAVKAGGETANRFFRMRGSFFLGAAGDDPQLPASPEALDAAQRRIDRIAAERRKKRNAG